MANGKIGRIRNSCAVFATLVASCSGDLVEDVGANAGKLFCQQWVDAITNWQSRCEGIPKEALQTAFAAIDVCRGLDLHRTRVCEPAATPPVNGLSSAPAAASMEPPMLRHPTSLLGSPVNRRARRFRGEITPGGA
jgi:hypothetical protein